MDNKLGDELECRTFSSFNQLKSMLTKNRQEFTEPVDENSCVNIQAIRLQLLLKKSEPKIANEMRRANTMVDKSVLLRETPKPAHERLKRSTRSAFRINLNFVRVCYDPEHLLVSRFNEDLMMQGLRNFLICLNENLTVCDEIHKLPNTMFAVRSTSNSVHIPANIRLLGITSGKDFLSKQIPERKKTLQKISTQLMQSAISAAKSFKEHRKNTFNVACQTDILQYNEWEMFEHKLEREINRNKSMS